MVVHVFASPILRESRFLGTRSGTVSGPFASRHQQPLAGGNQFRSHLPGPRNEQSGILGDADCSALGNLPLKSSP